MNVIKLSIDGLLIIEPKVFGDSRGYFFESYSEKKYKDAGIDADFIQDNESFSSFGVLRGLHFQQAPHTQAKLVRVIQGEVLDIAVDIRGGSRTFGQHEAVILSGENKRQFYIPRGFAHGFVVLSETALFSYKCDNFYAPDAERGVYFDDPALKIDWKIDKNKILLSEKDKKNPLLKDAETL